MASAKKIGRMVDKDVDKALADIGSTRPDMKDDGAELKAAVAPKNDLNFSEAFKANRMAGNKTFTWKGKSYTTKMVGEGAKRSAPNKPADKPASTPAKPAVTQAKPAATQAKPKAETTAAKPAASATRKTPVNAGRAEGFLSRMFKGDANSDFAKSQERKYGKSSGRPLLLVGEEARKANKGTIGGYAKGGKIDGCAIRGKTRAMKKGK